MVYCDGENPNGKPKWKEKPPEDFSTEEPEDDYVHKKANLFDEDSSTEYPNDADQAPAERDQPWEDYVLDYDSPPLRKLPAWKEKPPDLFTKWKYKPSNFFSTDEPEADNELEKADIRDGDESTEYPSVDAPPLKSHNRPWEDYEFSEEKPLRFELPEWKENLTNEDLSTDEPDDDMELKKGDLQDEDSSTEYPISADRELKAHNHPWEDYELDVDSPWDIALPEWKESPGDIMSTDEPEDEVQIEKANVSDEDSATDYPVGDDQDPRNKPWEDYEDDWDPASKLELPKWKENLPDEFSTDEPEDEIDYKKPQIHDEDSSTEYPSDAESAILPHLRPWEDYQDQLDSPFNPYLPEWKEIPLDDFSTDEPEEDKELKKAHIQDEDESTEYPISDDEVPEPLNWPWEDYEVDASDILQPSWPEWKESLPDEFSTDEPDYDSELKKSKTSDEETSTEYPEEVEPAHKRTYLRRPKRN